LHVARQNVFHRFAQGHARLFIRPFGLAIVGVETLFLVGHKKLYSVEATFFAVTQFAVF
jgi:hypothetical protein